ncbi:MAG: hypothetical protein JEZ02_03870 [Desulfatibacillum sp.]|nr:hypothetical protein [Desulfatibacillum sp.]
MVEPVNFNGKKQIKDANALRRGYSLSVLVGLALFICTGGLFIGFYLEGALGALLGFAAGLILSFLAVYVFQFLIEGISDNVGRIVFIGKKANWTLHEGLQSDLQQIRYAKANERYGEALTKVNQVLKKAPKWPEALFLKAEILWDGFEALEDAKSTLRQIITLPTPPDQYNTWAKEMYKKLSQIRREPS